MSLIYLWNISDKDAEWDKTFYVSFVNVSKELTSRLFHKPNKPPSEVVWLVTKLILVEVKIIEKPDLELIQTQSEKQMNSFPYCFKTKHSFSDTNSSYIIEYHSDKVKILTSSWDIPHNLTHSLVLLVWRHFLHADIHSRCPQCWEQESK